jgi:hypothetical protein
VLANERTLSKTDWQTMELQLAHRSDYFILRRKSAGATAETLQELFRLLAACLEPLRNTHHFTLLLDACPVHGTTRVITAAANHEFRLVFVPAGLTGVLQPLDAYFFGPLKQQLRMGFSDMLVRQEESTDVSTLDVLRLLWRLLDEMLNGKSWRHAFAGCGYVEHERSLGKRVRARLELPPGDTLVSAESLSLEHLEIVWMSKRTVQIDSLFPRKFICTSHDHRPAPHRIQTSQPPTDNLGHHLAPDVPLRLRLRSASRQHLLSTLEPDVAPTIHSSVSASASASCPAAPPPLPPPSQMPPPWLLASPAPPRLFRLGPALGHLPSPSPEGQQ